MILTINIPEKDIPKMQFIMDISLHFLDGQLVEYTAPSGWDIEKQEPCEDCISRQYLVDKAVSWDKHFADGIRYVALTDILNAPPVQPQTKQRTGRWTDDKCSVCGKGIEDLIDSHEWYRNEQPNFCPFCGVKLVEPQESEDEEE